MSFYSLWNLAIFGTVIEELLDLGCTFYTPWMGGQLDSGDFGHFLFPDVVGWLIGIDGNIERF